MRGIRCQSRAESFVFETVVPLSLGSDESIRELGFAVRLLGVEEIGLLLHPRQPTQGSPSKDTAHTSTLCSSLSNEGDFMFHSLGLI